jgi:hypothetical protein
MTMKRMLLVAVLVVCSACGRGDTEGGPPSSEAGGSVSADSAQKDNTGPAGARTGG